MEEELKVSGTFYNCVTYANMSIERAFRYAALHRSSSCSALALEMDERIET